MTQAERITALEVQVESLVEALKETNAALHELIVLRNKGAGAFWLASTLFGASLIAVVTTVMSWWKGH